MAQTQTQTQPQARTWTDDLTAVAPPMFADLNSIDRARLFYWLNRGHMREAGFFHTSARQGKPTLGKPWVEAEVFKDDPGYKAEGVSIAPICYRQRPFVWIEGGGGRKYRRYLAEWDGQSQFYIEVICFVRGSAEVWVLTGDGMIGQALEGILNEYKDGLLNYARSVYGLNAPLWSFWLPLTGRKEANGQPRFEQTGQGGLVTLPDLVYPARPFESLAESFKVGQEYLRHGIEVRYMYDAWVNV